MTEQELQRYFELVEKSKAGTLNQSKCEHIELKALAEQYATKLRADHAREQDENQKRLLEEAQRRQKEDEKHRQEQEIAHQVSWLKTVLNPKVSDEKLAQEWEKFREKVEA